MQPSNACYVVIAISVSTVWRRGNVLKSWDLFDYFSVLPFSFWISQFFSSEKQITWILQCHLWHRRARVSGSCQFLPTSGFSFSRFFQSNLQLWVTLESDLQILAVASSRASLWNPIPQFNLQMHGEIEVFGHQVRQRSQFGDCDCLCFEFDIVHHVYISVRNVAASSRSGKYFLIAADVDGWKIARATGTGHSVVLHMTGNFPKYSS